MSYKSWQLRQYTKVQSLYLSGPGSLRPIGGNMVYGVAAPIECGCPYTREANMQSVAWKEIPFPVLAKRLNIEKLLQAPSPDTSSGETSSSTVLTAYRFPTTEYCTSVSCGQLQQWSSGGTRDGGYPFSSPGSCRSVADKHPKRRQTQQLERVWVCESGHMDNVDPYCNLCSSDQSRVPLRKTREDNLERIYLECTGCGAASVLDLEESRKSCSGVVPHACSRRQDSADCSNSMRLYRLSDSEVWQASLRTALHFPPSFDLSEEQMDLVRLTYAACLSAQPELGGEALVLYICNRLNETRLATPNATQEVVQRAIDELSSADLGDDPSEQAIRLEEFRNIDELRRRSINHGGFVGRQASKLDTGLCPPIIGVSAVERLRLVTVLAAARRAGGAWSRSLIWGHQGASGAQGRSLPAFDSYGEGLVFWVDRGRLEEGDAMKSLHSLAHAALKAVTVRAGVSLAGLKERLYLPDEGDPVFMIYLATGDQAGTLGGLSSLAFDNNLPWLLEEIRGVIEDLAWCALDPQCSGKGGACHHCLHLPETCCDIAALDPSGKDSANDRLSRSTLRY